jgi:hypothetical protein
VRGRRGRRPLPPPGLVTASHSLLDLVDNVLTRGITLSGDVTLGIARVDLVYLRLQALLCAADRVFGTADAAGSGRGNRPHRSRTRGRRSLPVRGAR